MLNQKSLIFLETILQRRPHLNVFFSLFIFIDNHLLLLFIWIFLVLPDVVGVRWPDCAVPRQSFSCEPPQPFERSSGQRQRVLVVVLVQVNDGMVGYDGVSRDNLRAMNFWEVPSPMPATDHLLSNPHQLFTRSNYSHRRHALSRTKLKDFYLSLEINSLRGVCVCKECERQIFVHQLTPNGFT